MLSQVMSRDGYMQMKVDMLKRKALRRRPLHDLPDPVEWITNNFYIPETSQPIGLYESQIVPLREALRIGSDGTFEYSTVCWSAVKKSAKSTLAAAVAMWYAYNQPWSSVKVIANDLKQAASRSYEAIVKSIELNPVWRDTIKVNKYTITLPNHSVIEAIPIDPEGEAGGGDDFVLYTELWGWKHTKALRMWTESTLSPLKFGQSMRWAESYAGFEGESAVLEDLYKRCVSPEYLINEQWEMYRNGRTFCLWQTKGHLPWQTQEYYAQEEAELLPNEFLRIHKNKWSSGSEPFVPLAWWFSCHKQYARLTDKQKPIVIAMDAGVSNDTFGLVGVSKVGDDGVQTEYARSWTPPRGGKISFTNPDNPEDRDTPEGELRWLIANYNIVMVAYDPYQLEDMANRFAREGLAWMFAFTQGGMRLTADSNLRTLIREKRISHYGDSELDEHVGNAAAKTDGEDSKIRIIKKATNSKVDLCVALSMAADRVLYLNI